MTWRLLRMCRLIRQRGKYIQDRLQGLTYAFNELLEKVEDARDSETKPKESSASEVQECAEPHPADVVR